jgi:hypothetical protein
LSVKRIGVRTSRIVDPPNGRIPPATSDLTGPKCNANMIHWSSDTGALAHGTGKTVVKSGFQIG